MPFGVNPSALTVAGYLFGDTSILQVGTAIAVYCRFMHRYMSPSRPPCSMRLLAVGSISVVGRAQPVVAYEVIGRNR
jgi:hypothetical protein